jgi:hypothetical protein
VPRVVARVGADGEIDTTTSTTSHGGDNVRAAATVDGTSYWVAGASGGVTRIVHGGSGAATDISGSSVTNARTVEILGSTLYGTTGSSTLRMFAFGAALPTSASTATILPGTPTATTSPYAMAGIATAGSTIDRLYVCDDRSPGGGPQRWHRSSSGDWTLDTTFHEGTAEIPCRGIAVAVSGSTVTLVVTTSDSRLVAFIDTTTGLASPPSVVIATSPFGTFYRGLAFAPSP